MLNSHYHLIGIGGIGMSALAHLLLNRCATVSGSDSSWNATLEDLNKKGAVIYRQQLAKQINSQMTVVYSSDIKLENVEYQAALDCQCRLIHRSDLLVELTQGYHSLAIAGTHGKTTTSSLLATVLVEAKLDPSFAIGGILPAFQSNAWGGKGDLFVFEADESDGTFIKYHPFGAIVTNINNDHLNNFQHSEKNLIEAFSLFASQVQSSAHFFWCGDNLHLKSLNLKGFSYGFNADCDWQIIDFNQEGFESVFTLFHQGQIFKDIFLPLIGLHNLLNAGAVFGLALALGVSEASIRQGFKSFKGVLRRCEIKAVYNDILFIDDYAHHPTEIQTTLQGIRKAIANRRLIVVFQPHRYSRTQTCLGQYKKIFELADQLVLTDIFAAGEAPVANLSHLTVQNEIEKHSEVVCEYVPRSAISHYLSHALQPCDVVVTLGAGDITKVTDETLNRLEYV